MVLLGVIFVSLAAALFCLSFGLFLVALVAGGCAEREQEEMVLRAMSYERRA